MKAALKKVLVVLASKQARPAELVLARLILGALGATEIAGLLKALGA